MSERPVLVAATANPHKLAEIAEILGDAVDLWPRPDDVPEVVEDAPDLVGNARLKATAIWRATGRDAIADDTGLEVDALGGEPGVQSARFAGPDASDADNVALLLARLDGAADRRARFRTVACVVGPAGVTLAEGVCEGVILPERRGTHGFGYDPVFVPVEGDGRTFAEMDAPDKHALSHRGRAFRALAARLAGTEPTGAG